MIGVLVLGADDPKRFEAGQGTQHLARIGALLGTCLAAARPRGA